MYTVQEWKDGKVVIDYRKSQNAAKLHRIVKAAYPNCIDLPMAVSDIYWSTGHGWDSALKEEWKEAVPMCSVDDIILPATATKQEK